MQNVKKRFHCNVQYISNVWYNYKIIIIIIIIIIFHFVNFICRPTSTKPQHEN